MKLTCALLLSTAIATTAAVLTPTVHAAATACETLASLVLPKATISAAQTVAADGFSPPGGRGGSPAMANLPAFCRVAATLTPSADSDIKVEVWMPASGWNGKFQAVGNGGWSGSI